MKLEIQQITETKGKHLISIEARKAFDLRGYSFYIHKTVDNEYSYTITEKTSGMAVYIGNSNQTEKSVKQFAIDIIENAKNLDDIIKKAVYSKNMIITVDLFKCAGVLA